MKPNTEYLSVKMSITINYVLFFFRYIVVTYASLASKNKTCVYDSVIGGISFSFLYVKIMRLPFRNTRA